jgi:hypothetical protein
MSGHLLVSCTKCSREPGPSKAMMWPRRSAQLSTKSHTGRGCLHRLRFESFFNAALKGSQEADPRCSRRAACTRRCIPGAGRCGPRPARAVRQVATIAVLDCRTRARNRLDGGNRAERDADASNHSDSPTVALRHRNARRPTAQGLATIAASQSPPTGVTSCTFRGELVQPAFPDNSHRDKLRDRRSGAGGEARRDVAAAPARDSRRASQIASTL